MPKTTRQDKSPRRRDKPASTPPPEPESEPESESSTSSVVSNHDDDHITDDSSSTSSEQERPVVPVASNRGRKSDKDSTSTKASKSSTSTAAVLPVRSHEKRKGNVVKESTKKITRVAPKEEEDDDSSSSDEGDTTHITTTTTGAGATTAAARKAAATPELIIESFDNILESIASRTKDTSESKSSIQYLKGLHKEIKALRAMTKPILKKPRKTNPANTTKNTGIQRPVKVSKEVAKFAGWKEDELHSRVEVTRYICDYIKRNDLQNPKNKKQIIPDNKLRKLLGYDPNSDPPLTYFNIQTFLKKQNHFQ